MIVTYCVATKEILKLRNLLRHSAVTVALMVKRSQTEQVCETLIFILKLKSVTVRQ
jgi:hypothetical protein